MAVLNTSDLFFEDIQKLKKENVKLPTKVWELISDIRNNIDSPGKGIGQPEALKHDMAGYYSRRITDKHRLIYRVENGIIYLVSCYGHYTDF